MLNKNCFECKEKLCNSLFSLHMLYRASYFGFIQADMLLYSMIKKNMRRFILIGKNPKFASLI